MCLMEILYDATSHLFQTRCSVTSCWGRDTGQGGRKSIHQGNDPMLQSGPLFPWRAGCFTSLPMPHSLPTPAATSESSPLGTEADADGFVPWANHWPSRFLNVMAESYRPDSQSGEEAARSGRAHLKEPSPPPASLRPISNQPSPPPPPSGLYPISSRLSGS